MNLDFGFTTLSWSLLVICIVLFYFWLRAEGKIRGTRRE